MAGTRLLEMDEVERFINRGPPEGRIIYGAKVPKHDKASHLNLGRSCRHNVPSQQRSAALCLLFLDSISVVLSYLGRGIEGVHILAEYAHGSFIL
jgi:hypothetical protein